MVLRQLFSKALLPNLERDISRSVTKEVAAIDELMFLAPRIFSYQKSQGGAGVFGRTGMHVHRSFYRMFLFTS